MTSVSDPQISPQQSLQNHYCNLGSSVVTNISSSNFTLPIQSKKSPTVGPTNERTPKKPEYLIVRSQLTERGPLGRSHLDGSKTRLYSFETYPKKIAAHDPQYIGDGSETLSRNGFQWKFLVPCNEGVEIFGLIKGNLLVNKSPHHKASYFWEKFVRVGWLAMIQVQYITCVQGNGPSG